MTDKISETDLENANTDAETLASLITGTGTVVNRLGATLKTYAQIMADYALIAGTSASGFNVDATYHTLGLNCTPRANANNPMRVEKYGAANTGIEFVWISSTEMQVLSYDRTSDIHNALGLNGSYIPFYVVNSEKARISATGQFIAGATSSAHGHAVTWAGNGVYSFRAVSSHASNPFGINISYSGAAPNGSSNEFLYCGDTGGGRLVIASNGNVTNANNSYGAISDQKLKQDIVPATSQWSDVKAIGAIVSKYRFKSAPAGPLHIGLIAQDLEGISPGLVESAPDKTTEGVLIEGEETKSVKYSVLFVKAVKALSEAMERIEALEAKVTALEAP